MKVKKILFKGGVPALMKEKKGLFLNIHYASMQGILWIMMAIFLVFLVPLLRDRGFTETQIGVLLAVRSFIGIFSQPLLASFVDKYEYKIPLKYIIGATIFLCLVANIVFIFYMFSFGATCIIFAILGMTLNSLSPLYSSLAMQFTRAGKPINFSIARGIGSISYAVVCILLGYVTDYFSTSIILHMNTILLLLSLIIILFFEGYIPVSQAKSEKRAISHSSIALLKKNIPFTLFLLASVFLFIGHSMSTSFFVDVIYKLGGSNQNLGSAQFILAISEFPVAICFLKIQKKLGTNRILCISALFMLLKTVGILLAPSLSILYCVQLLQSMGYGIYWAASVYFVDENIDYSDMVKGQSLMNISSVGIGHGIGSIISGKILEAFDIDALILFASIFTLIGTIIMFYGMHTHSVTNKKTERSLHA